MTKKFEFVPTEEGVDFAVYDFSDPTRTEIAPGVHLLFAFFNAARFLPSGDGNGNGALMCTYEPGEQPDTGSDLVSKETLLPVSVRCNTDGQVVEKRRRFLQLSYVEDIRSVPVSASYRLIEKPPKAPEKAAAEPVAGAWLGGKIKWLADPLTLDAAFLFQMSLDVLNRNIDRKKQMMDVASLYGFVRPVTGFGPRGFCLTQG